MNTEIGKNVNHKFSSHNSSNRNGEHLTDFTLENRLSRLNKNFHKRKRKLWTDTYANNAKAHTHHVFINKKRKNSALNCEAYFSFKDVSSDHRIFTSKIQLILRKNAVWTTTTVHFDWSLFNNRNIRDKYRLTLKKQIRCTSGDIRNP